MKPAAILRALLACALLPAGVPLARGMSLEERSARFEKYCTRLRNLVKAYALREHELSAWCEARGMVEQARAARTRARSCDGSLQPNPEGVPGKREPDAEKAYSRKLFALRGKTSRDYLALAEACLEKGLLFESRRALEKALIWNSRNGDARRLSSKPALKGTLLSRIGKEKRTGVWKGGRWVPEEEFQRHGRARIRRLIVDKKKAYGLEFKGDFLPCVDFLYTVAQDRFDPVKAAVMDYFEHVRPRYFLSDPKKPFLFFYLQGPEEFRKVGQKPYMGGAYEWGKGEIYAVPGLLALPGLSGTGTVLHELTHAMLEANFKRFPPLWMNEGFACFFETHGDLKEGRPFGFVNARDHWYAGALQKGTARTLERLFKECAMSIDPLGYGQGRALMNYLWSLGQLEAYLISAQLLEKDMDFPSILTDLLREPVFKIGKGLEAFARTLPKPGERIERGRRPDEAIDACMGDGPLPE